MGLHALGISSHAPLPFDCAWCMKSASLELYFEEIDSVRKKIRDIEIYQSLEIDFIPNVQGPSDFAAHLDYTIGSIHFVHSFPSGEPWEIDGSHSVFLKGLEEIYHGSIQDAIHEYFALVRQMVRHNPPTILGHLDKIKIQNQENKLFDPASRWYRSEVLATLDELAQSTCLVEVNTRGLYTAKTNETYPGPWILQEMKNRNIPIVFTSDAHHRKDLISHFADAKKTAFDAGYRFCKVLRQGVWQDTSL
jgi:histidinol-phosphatase (PHP family)